MSKFDELKKNYEAERLLLEELLSDRERMPWEKETYRARLSNLKTRIELTNACLKEREETLWRDVLSRDGCGNPTYETLDEWRIGEEYL